MVFVACGPTGEPRTGPTKATSTAGPATAIDAPDNSTETGNPGTIYPETSDATNEDISTSSTDSTIELFPKWEVGEVRSFEIIKKSIDSFQGIIQREATSRVPLNIEVVEIFENGYVLRWTFGEAENEIVPVGADPIQDTMMNLEDGMIFEYEVDKRGVPVKLRNWEEIRNLRQKALERSLTALQENGLPQTDVDQIRYVLEPMHGTKQQIEDYTLGQVESYHFIYGNEPLKSSSPKILQGFMPNLFGGDPFPSIEKWEIMDFEPDATEITLIKTQSLDPIPARQVLLESLTEMALATGDAPPTMNDLPESFSIEHYSEAVIDTQSGWIKSVENTTTAIFDTYVNKDIIKIY